MKHIHHIIILLLAVLVASCGKDFQDDIDKLKATHNSIDQRVGSLEADATATNTQLSRIAVLANAVEQGFYIKDVKTTDEGYELTLSNDQKVVLQTTPDGTLTSAPAISMMQMDGLFYWTLNGMLFTDTDGKPIRSTGQTPVVKYDYTLNQWVVSIDGGLTFKDISTYVSVFINDEVLMQIINTYVSQYNTTIFSQQLLYQIVTNYIQQSYMQVFDTKVLKIVVDNYVKEHYTRIFSYQLLEEIFTQYNYEYVTTNIKVEELVEAMVSFIKEHKEIFENNEVLYEIISSYLKANQTTIFSEEILLEVINTFINEHQNYIDIDLLTQVVHNYIDTHRDVVFNTETVRQMLQEYIKRYYVKVFSENLLMQMFNIYITQNRTTIFSETLLTEIINHHVQNNFFSIISEETISNLIKTYVEENHTTIFKRELIVEIITNFLKTYEFHVEREEIERAIDEYVLKYKAQIIDIDLVTSIVRSYVTTYYRRLFDVDVLTKIVVQYLNDNKEYVTKHIKVGKDIIGSIAVDDDLCTVTLSNGQVFRLVVYDAMARLRDRVQSIVVLPDEDGHVKEVGGQLSMNYLVSPAAMAKVIDSKYNSKEFTLELKATDGGGNISTIGVGSLSLVSSGILNVTASVAAGTVKAVALHVMDKKLGGTDIMTEFTAVGDGSTPVTFNPCPDGNHPHTMDLGLPSGTLWSCCNVGATAPLEYGNYYAWGETMTKSQYNRDTYLYYQNDGYVNIGSDIANTQWDAATVNWGAPWCMPNIDQCRELIEKLSSKWVTINGVSGRLFTGLNGNELFLPAIGDFWARAARVAGTCGSYWSSSIAETQYGRDLFIDDKAVTAAHYDYRYYGRGIRPVVAQPKYHKDCPDDNHPHMIDLGLPSGTKWACCNVGAKAPSQIGNYYAWGETKPKSKYDWDTYAYYKAATGYENIGTDIAGTSYDAATANWGTSWRMPSKAQCQELIKNSTYEYTTKDGINGLKFTSKLNEGILFIPAAGYRWGSDLVGTGTSGYYWSSMCPSIDNDTHSSFYLFFELGVSGVSDYYIGYGLSVRPVLYE